MRFATYALAALTTLLAFFVVPEIASASAIHVTSFADNATGCTLRNAITAANTNAVVGTCAAGQVAPAVDTIDFPAASASTITLGSALPQVSGPVTIAGPGIAQLEINGVALYQPFRIASGVVGISGLTVNNGRCNQSCGAQGGAIHNSGTLTLDEVAISGSNASSTAAGTNNFAEGGAIENTGGSTLTITDSSIRNNAVTALNATNQNGASGGGIMNRGTLTVLRSTIAGNAAIVNAGVGATGNVTGGGIESNGGVTISASLISNNQVTAAGAGTSSASGGAIGQFNNPAAVSLNIDRSTIAGNSSTGGAGGIQSIGTPGTVTNSTIFGNSAPSGANLTLSAPLTLTNTIVSNPTAGPNCSSAGVISGGHNIEGGGNTCGLNQAGDLTNTNPMLGVLADNGGPTFTRVPQPGSPAIDAGKVAAGDSTDQRGLIRPSDIDSIANATGGDGSDIGAVEVQDTVAPDTAISSGPAEGSVSKGPATFAFTSTEAVSMFECSVDSGAFASCASPDALSGLGDGSHTFAVRAVDGTLNADASPATRSFLIDAKAPTTKLGKFKKRTSKPKVKLKFSSEKGAKFECRVDSKPFTACTSPYRTKRLKPGKHLIEVRATDAAGNVEAKPAKAKVKVTS